MNKGLIQVKENGIILKNQDSFELAHIFNCGQCFRWNQESDQSFTGVAHGRVLNVQKLGKDIHFNGTTLADFENLWVEYFDLETDYEKIKLELSAADHIMGEVTRFGGGLRILKQDLWETIISFIISANNNIPRIKKIIEQLSLQYGENLGQIGGTGYYAFPRPEVLREVSEAELRACNTGYRASYIKATAEKIAAMEVDLNLLKNQTSVDCLNWLMKFNGVGPKVANCIAFFALAKLDSFPVDVWIKRLMEFYYFKKTSPAKQIEDFARDKFGQYAGYAQQYLFYYGRELEIGKGEKQPC